MAPADFFNDIQRYIPTDDIPLVISALRNDPLIWVNINNPDTMQKILAKENNILDVLTPAGLCLLVLDSKYSTDVLAQDPLLPIDNDLRISALKLYEETINSGLPVNTLEKAGLLALAMRERCRVTQSWKGLITEITHNNGFTDHTLEIWQTPLNCLYGMTPDADQIFVDSWGEEDQIIIPKIISHIYFSYPLTYEEIAQKLFVHMDRISPVQRIKWIREINQTGYITVANHLSRRLIAEYKDEQPGSMEISRQEDWKAVSRKIQELDYLVNLNRLSGRNAEAVKNCLQMQKSLENLANRYLFFAYDAESKMDPSQQIAQEFTEDIRQVVKNSALLVEYAFMEDNLSEIMPLLAEKKEKFGNPFIDLLQIVSTSNPENRSETIYKIRRTVAEFISPNVNLDDYIPSGVFDWKPCRFIQILLDLNLPEEALHLAIRFLEIRPSDIELMDLTGHIYQKEGDIANAVYYANLCLMMNPSSVDSHRRMAELWEASQSWDKSLTERNQVLQLVSEPGHNDWLAYIQSAINSGEFEQAAVVCGNLLENDPNSGPANRMMGLALAGLGNLPEAILYLNRATLLTPEDASAWLVLIDCYRREVENQRVIETLRTAVLAVPNSLEINFLLAEACLENGSLSEALPFLRKAARLTPNSLPVALKLGNTLYLLGYIAEACQVFEQARLAWPQDAELAIAYANILVSMDELEKSIPLFEVALKSSVPLPLWYVNYSEVLLGQGKLFLINNHSTIDYARLVNAQQALEKALISEPDDFRAQLLTAEISVLKDDYLQASQLYQLLANYPESLLPEWHWRIQAGIGISASHLGETETAIAALQEATQLKPQHYMLQRALAQAYLDGALTNESMRIARSALRLAPDDIDNLSWFADIAMKMTAWSEAIEALQCITQLSPDEPNNWIRLAMSQYQSGDVEGVRGSLAEMLMIECLTIEDYRQASRLYSQIEDRDSAYRCLELAVRVVPSPTSDLYFEMAFLSCQMSRLEEALEIIQQASKLTPSSPMLYIFEADLLAWLGRYQAAVACVEHVLNRIEIYSIDNNNVILDMDALLPILPLAWTSTMKTKAHLHARLASWFGRLGDYSQAINNAETASDLSPDDLSFKIITTHLYMAIMDFQKAATKCEVPALSEITSETLKTTDVSNWADLVGMNLEIAIENGCEIPFSQENLDEIAGLTNSIRLLTAQSRLAMINGEWIPAQQFYQRALNAELYATSNNAISANYLNNYSITYEMQKNTLLVLAESACELNRWEEAISMVDSYVCENVNEIYGNYVYAKILVKCVEKQRLYSELRCESHAPGLAALSNERFEMFEKTIIAASKYSKYDKINHLQIKGRALFRPLPQNVRALVNSITNSDDTACLVLILRQLRNCTLGIQVAQNCVDIPAVSLQLALCYQEIDPEKGFIIANNLVDKKHNFPISQITLAQIAEKLDHVVEALEKIEDALIIWPEEAEWHVWAAQLAGQLERKRVVVSHYESALNLHPERLNYVVDLCQSYLELSSPNKALELLSAYSRQYPNDANIWLTMAYAYRQIGLYKEALDCADMAFKLADGSIAPLILSGEISLDMHNPDDAYQFALNASKQEPDAIGPVLLLVKVLESKGKKHESIQILDQYLDKHNSVPAQFEKARLTQELEGPVAALPLLTKIAENNPSNLEILTALAKNQSACGYLQAAEKTINSALQLDPERYELNFLMGQIKHKTGQLDQAIFYLSESIKLSPNEVEAYMELGSTYILRREPSQAVKIYQQAMEIAPNDYRPYYQLGLVMRDYKDYLGAENMLRKAAKLSPSDVNIRKQLGAIIALNLVHNSQEVNIYS